MLICESRFKGYSCSPLLHSFIVQAYDHALGVVKARISKPAPGFTAAAVVKGKFDDVKLSDYIGKFF